MGSSIKGMQPLEFMKFVKEETSMDLQATINRTKLWETINVTTYYLPNSTMVIEDSWIFNTQFPMSIPSIPTSQPTQYQLTFVRMYILAPMLDNLPLIPMSIQKSSKRTKYWD
jgi:hypothetical protein